MLTEVQGMQHITYMKIFQTFFLVLFDHDPSVALPPDTAAGLCF